MAEVVAHLLHQPQTLPRSIEVIIVFLGQAGTLKFISTDGKTLQRCWPVFPEFIFKKNYAQVKLGIKWEQKHNKLEITSENRNSNWESNFPKFFWGFERIEELNEKHPNAKTNSPFPRPIIFEAIHVSIRSLYSKIFFRNLFQEGRYLPHHRLLQKPLGKNPIQEVTIFSK